MQSVLWRAPGCSAGIWGRDLIPQEVLYRRSTPGAVAASRPSSGRSAATPGLGRHPGARSRSGDIVPARCAVFARPRTLVCSRQLLIHRLRLRENGQHSGPSSSERCRRLWVTPRFRHGTPSSGSDTNTLRLMPDTHEAPLCRSSGAPPRCNPTPPVCTGGCNPGLLRRREGDRHAKGGFR